MKLRTSLLLLGVVFIGLTEASVKGCSCGHSQYNDEELDAFYNVTKLISSFVEFKPINENVLKDFEQHMKHEENLPANSVDMGFAEMSLRHQMVMHRDVKKIAEDNSNMETRISEDLKNISGQWTENVLDITNDLATERDDLKKKLDKITNYLYKELGKINTDIKQIKKLCSETVHQGIITNEVENENKIEELIKNVVNEILESMRKSEHGVSTDINRQLNDIKNFVLDENKELKRKVNVKLFKINNTLSDNIEIVHHQIINKIIQESKPFDCSDVQRSGITNSGVYTIYPFSNDTNITRQVFCHMESEDMAWTVFLARLKQPQQLNFTRAWDDYKNGFGSPDGEYWLGNEILHSMTSNRSYTIQVEFTVSNTEHWAEFSSFYVGSEDDKYELKLSGYNTRSSVKENVIMSLNGHKFSTVDQDNNQIQGMRCPESCKGGWWYHSCFDIHGTGLYDSTSYCSALMVVKERFVYPSRFQMKIRPNSSE